MATFSASVVIDRSVEDVFAFLARTENETQWQKDLLESKTTSGGPLGVGTTGRDVRKSMGREVVTHWECTAYEPNVMFGFKVTKPVAFTAAYHFDAAPGGTRVTMTAQPVGLTRLLWPMVARAGKKQYEADFATLKRILEERP